MAAVASPLDIEKTYIPNEMDTEVKKSRMKCQRKYGFCDSICACVCCGICSSILLVFLGIFITISYMYLDTYLITDYTNIKYEATDGTTLHAYLATPTPAAAEEAALASNSSTPMSAIVFHAWNGIGEEAIYFADRLAEQGYHAIAPDLFRGVATAPTNIVRNIVNVVTAPQDRINADADSALAYLETTLTINPKDVISGPGFCFGGGQSLIFAARHEVAATVTCYGTQIRALGDPDSEEWGVLGSTGPVLGIYGREDAAPSPEEVDTFEVALGERGVPHNITIYEEVGHAFITPEAHSDVNSPTHRQAFDAWEQISNFIDNAMHDHNLIVETQEERRLELEPSEEAGKGKWGNTMRSRVRCALKCGLDVLVGTGHFHHKGLPTLGLQALLERL